MITPEKRGNNRDVSAERCCDVATVPGTPGSYSWSDPREDARTPAGSSIAFPRMPPGLSAAGMLVHLAEKRRRWVTEIAALQLAIKRVDELAGALQGLEER